MMLVATDAGSNTLRLLIGLMQRPRISSLTARDSGILEGLLLSLQSAE